MTRRLKSPLLVTIFIIAVTVFNGCSKDKVFVTVIAEPATISPTETSSITTIVTAGKDTATAKPIEGATVRLWVAAGEKVFARLSETTATTDKEGNAVVELTALDISPNKAIHVTVKVKDASSSCTVMVKKRPMTEAQEAKSE